MPFVGSTERRQTIEGMTVAVMVWCLYFMYHMTIVSPEDEMISLIRSTAIYGTLLIGLGLLTGPLARIFPAWNTIRHRRTLSVVGFSFIIVHVIAAIMRTPALAERIFVPFTPPFFGILGFLIFLVLYATSNDASMKRFGYRKWKVVHRFVYIGWVFSVLHLLTANPLALINLPGFLLVVIIILVFIFELTAFVVYVTTKDRHGVVLGILVIAVGVAGFLLAYELYRNPVLLLCIPAVFGGFLFLYSYTLLHSRLHHASPSPSQPSSAQPAS